MKWIDLPNGSTLRLMQDLYSMQEVHSDLHYQLLTKAEVDDIIAISYNKGDMFVFDKDEELMTSDDGYLGIDIDGEIDKELYVVVDPNAH